MNKNRFTESLKQIKIALILLLLFTLLTGIIYPVIVTVIAQLFFPWQANGSMIEQNGKQVGSLLMGQSFTGPRYFWSRPSATMPFPYNAAHSSGSNLGPANPDFLAAVAQRVSDLHQADPENHAAIPVDLVTTSASGLDPDISPQAAFYQVHRIAKARGIDEKQLYLLIKQSIQSRCLYIFGEPRVNVLKLNMALDHVIEQQPFSAHQWIPLFLRRLDTWMFPLRQGWRVWSRKTGGSTGEPRMADRTR